MNSRIELSDDGDRIEIYIDANFKRKSGRKRILAPDGRPVNPDRNPLADQALLTALIRAHRWSRWLDEGRFESIKQIAKHEGISSATYASRILRLTLLSPAIQAAILDGTHPPTLTLADLERPFPLEWREQEGVFLCSNKRP